jgi:hypothetical protein
MAYTKYSLTPANNTATPPDGAPEGMLPSAVNDTMRDMMAQIRDVGDGIRDGTYTMTAAKITGGTITGATINNSAIGGTTAAAGAFTTLSATGATTFSGATVVSGSLTANTFSSSGATITGGTINSTAIGGTTAAAGKFTTLEATGVTTVQAGTVSAPAITTSGDTNTGIFFPAADTIAFTEGGAEAMRIDSSGNVGIGTSSPQVKLHIAGPLAVQGASGFPTSGKGWELLVEGTVDNAIQSYNRDTSSWMNAKYYANQHIWITSSAERMRIDSSGNVLIGTTTTTNNLRLNAKLSVVSTGAGNFGGIVVPSYSGTTAGAASFMDFTRSRGTTDGSLTSVQNGDALGYIVFRGTDGTVISDAATIVAEVDGVTGSSGQIPGRLIFNTKSGNTLAERMRIDSSGNVGIGTSSPNARLDILGSSSRLRLDGSSASFQILSRNTADSTTNPLIFDADTYTLNRAGTTRMFIDSSGNVGIGTSSPAAPIDVVSNSSAHALRVRGRSSEDTGQIRFTNNAGSTTYAVLQTNSGEFSIQGVANSPTVFYTNNTERMRITSGGNVWIGTSSSSFGSRFAVEKNGGDVVGFGNTNVVAGETVMTVKGGVNTTDTTTTYIIFQRADGTTRGTIVATGTNGVVYNTSSDYRLKENIEPMTGALAKVQALNPVTYKWKEDGLDGQGFVAHELAEVFPDAVTGEKDAVNEDGSIKPQGIDTSVLVATLAAAIKELNAKVEAQAAEIALLKSK